MNSRGMHQGHAAGARCRGVAQSGAQEEDADTSEPRRPAAEEFVAIAAHELRSPITTIHLSLHALRRQARSESPPSTAELDRKLEGALRQTRRLQNLVQNLLDVTRLRIADIAVEREPLDLVDVVKDVVDACQPLAAPAGCRLVSDLPERLRGSWDLMRIEQVVTNLVANACKYAPGSRVVVRLEEAADHVRLVVEDDGPGVREEVARRIFEPFVREITGGTRAAGGLGLGLYIVRSIAKAHGGACWVETCDGQGARFVVTLAKDSVQEGTGRD